MEIYLDNAATTKAAEPVCDVMMQVMRQDYGNPSSKHQKGLEAERYIRSAAQDIAGILKVDPKEICFTSGGTESNNMAIKGAAAAYMRRGKHLISTMIEHPSVTNPLLELEKKGFEVTWIPTDAHGTVDVQAIRDAIRPDTILVSVMAVNNEIGTIQPVEAIGKAVHAANPDILFHVDAIQGFGKIPLYPRRMKIDLMSVSGHKLHGPKGIGFLYVRQGVRLIPLMQGGGQQKDLRSGTENVPGIAGLGAACRLMFTDWQEKTDHMYAMRNSLIERLADIPGAHIQGFGVCGPGEGMAAPHVINVSFENIKAEVLLHALEPEGIYVSSGSACSSNHPALSGTLKAIGVPASLLDASIRLSLCPDNTMEEMEVCAQVLAKTVSMLRSHTAGRQR